MSDTTEPATEPQVAFLRSLATRRAIFGHDMNRDQTIAEVERRITEGLNKDSASELLTQATASEWHRKTDVAASAHDIRLVRQYATEYALFGLAYNVEETIAKVEEAINGVFFSAHAARELINLGYRAQSHPTAQTALPLSLVEDIDGLTISEGHYAVFDDADVLRFYRIYTPATGANKDEAVIRRFAGDNLRGLYPIEARVVLHAIDADPDAAAYRYSDTFTRCWICGRSLTDAVSRLLSVGPTCRGFANHTGLRAAADDVDHNTERRGVCRALRQWALEQGFRDPMNKQERAGATMTASRVASAWSGIPGMLAHTPAEAVQVVNTALRDEVSNEVREGLFAAPQDTLLILVESGVLSTEVMQVLVEHPREKVRNAATEFFLSLLSD